MDEKTKAAQRLIELLEGDIKSVPFIVGYLTWQMEPETMLRAVDQYLAHDEAITAMVTARRLAQDEAGNVSKE